MEYVALKESYGMNGGYIEKGEVVFISEEARALIDEEYFSSLFEPVVKKNLDEATVVSDEEPEVPEEPEESQEEVEEDNEAEEEPLVKEEKPKKTSTRKTTKK